MPLPIALTVSASDSGGVAGVQADLKTFDALRVHGTSVITAVTARSTTAVTAVHEVPAAIVAEQLRAVLSDLRPGAVKVGTLTTVPTVRAVVTELARLRGPIVVDPVMVDRDGAHLLRSTSVDALVRDLLPLAVLVTPSLAEASLLSGIAIRTEADLKAAARKIQALGPQGVLIKGGYGEGAAVVDALLDGRTWHRFSAVRLDIAASCGAGCTLSSAVAAYLARGETLPDAVQKGLAYVRLALQHAPGLGSGPGPLGHHRAGELMR